MDSFEIHSLQQNFRDQTKTHQLMMMNTPLNSNTLKTHYCRLCHHKVSSSKFTSMTYELLETWQLFHPELRYNDRICHRHNIDEKEARARLTQIANTPPPSPMLVQQVDHLTMEVQQQQQQRQLIENERLEPPNKVVLHKHISIKKDQYFSVNIIKDCDSATLFFTGIPTYKQFLEFYGSLRFDLKPLQFLRHSTITNRAKACRYSNEEKLFWTLSRDRLDLEIEFFVHTTGASLGHVCESILSIVRRVVEMRKDDIKFLSGAELFEHTPYDYDVAGFKLQKGVNYYSSDFTYIHIQHSSRADFAQATWLDFKKGYYMLVGVINALDGTPVYIIPPTTSREPQNTLWNNMKINDVFPKDQQNFVFVDKGMNNIKPSGNVHFICMDKAETKTSIGPRGGKQKEIVQANTMQIYKSKYIAHYRVVSEQFFGKMKNWRLLSGTVPNCSLLSLSDHFTFIAILVKNFRYGDKIGPGVSL